MLVRGEIPHLAKFSASLASAQQIKNTYVSAIYPPNPLSISLNTDGTYEKDLCDQIQKVRFSQEGKKLLKSSKMQTFTMSQQPCSGPCHHSECKQRECQIPSLSLADYGLYLSHQLNNRMLNLGNWNLPCFALAEHARNYNFVGREDVLNLMDTYLLPQEISSADMTSIRSYAICGASGIGKTELAVEYAYSRRQQFGAVFWLHAGNAAQLMADFCQIPSYLGLANAHSHPTPESRKKLAKSWLNNPKKSVDWGVNCRWLLIFDDADLDIIRSYIPSGGNGSILITSRNHAAKDCFFENGPGIDLSPFSVTGTR